MTPFHPLALEDYERYRRYYDRCRDKSADYSFINMWGWNDKYHFELDYDDDLCWICSRGRHHCHMYSPIGKWQQENWPQRMSLFSEGCLKFHRIPENLAGQIKKGYPGRIFIKEDRGNWEYIYDAAELTALSGQKYRSKRKGASQFKEMYDYEYRPITSKDIPELCNFQKNWLSQPENSAEGCLLEENKAIHRILEHWHIFKDRLHGGILRVNGEIVAYTVAENVAPQEMIIHFEKALYNYKGAYAAINQLFLENNPDCRLVNREQDMNDPGLRRVKMNYKPIKFLKKYDLICFELH